MARDVVTIDTRHLRASVGRMVGELRRPATAYGKAARHMRDYVRQTITLQGRKRPYKSLSHWTKARTGRRKALITLRKEIKAGWSNTQGIVYFNRVSPEWHIDMHHTGFTSPPVMHKRMVVPMAAGGVYAAFFHRKASKVPAREVWPTKKEVIQEVTPLFHQWVEGLARKSWR